MNDQFGFFSNFTKNKGNKNQAIRVPKMIQPNINQAILTSDEDTDDEINTKMAGMIQNKILNSTTNPGDKTFCSELEIDPPDPNSEPIFNTESSTSSKSRKQSTISEKIQAETIVGSFSSDEERLSSRISELQIKSVKKSNKRSTLRETVCDSFSSDEENQSEVQAANLTQENIKKITEISVKTPLMRETVVGSFSSDDDGDEVFTKPNPALKSLPPKPQSDLRETINQPFDYSESYTSIRKSVRSQMIESIQEEIESAVEKFSELEVEENHQDEVEQEDDDTSDSEVECITVKDSDEEDEFGISNLKDDDEPPRFEPKDSFENVSTVHDDSEIPKPDSDTTLNRFFNNPPSLDSNLVVTHSVIQNHFAKPVEKLKKISEEPKTTPNRFKEQKIDENLEESFELDETICSDDEVVDPTMSDENDGAEVESENSFKSPEKESNTETSSQLTTVETKKNVEVGNFQLKINLNLEITVEDESSSDEEQKDSDSSHKKSEKTQVSTPKVLTPKPSVVIQEKQIQKPSSSSKKKTSIPFDNNFETPPKKTESDAVIDEDMQKLLDDLYGESWKTPQLLKSCKTKKVREDLRKSIALNKFQDFVKDLPKDLESTRIDSPMRINEVQQKESYETPKLSKETFKKPLTSNKKTPLNSKKPESSAKSTPRWQEICDPETSSSEDEYEEESSAESNDEDFNPNETWNASSDEDEDVESDDDEEKVQKPKRKTKSHKDEEMIFVPPSTVKKSAIKTLADFEFKEPPKMPGIATPKKHSKRKLFTHTHYEDEEESNNEIDKIQTKDNDKENVNIMTPLQIPSITTIKKITPKDKILTPKGQVKKTPILSTSHSMKFEKYSFLKSLDVETTCKSLCDPEALYYRDNYKIKKVELAQKLHQIYNENIFNGELKDLEIKWNKKLLNTAGRCNNSRKCGERKSFLELSDKVLTSADRLRCTLIHEMCHAATWIFNGENGHGVRWKMWAAKANKVFPELPKISVCHSYVIDYRYTYKCVNCNAKHQAHSKSKKVENIRCSICKSAIEIFLNKKNKNGEIVMTPVAKEVKGFPKFVKMKFKDVKKPNMTHKEVMQILSQQYAALSVEEKQMLMA